MSKDFIITVTVVLVSTVSADSREEAIELVKESLYQEYNLDITDGEITSVEEA